MKTSFHAAAALVAAAGTAHAQASYPTLTAQVSTGYSAVELRYNMVER